MKRLVLILLTVLLMFTSCSGVSSAEKKLIEQFTTAMKSYNKQAMSELLTEFPDKTPYVYIDDIFNDQKYVDLYRKLYTNISYEIKSSKNDSITIEMTMPNIQKLYTDSAAFVMNLALSDTELISKLDENEENGVILIQEIMLTYADQKDAVEMMTVEFTLKTVQDGGKLRIVCDDALRAMLTGNFFLSKNSTLSD